MSIEGYTDSKGSQSRNIDLSQRRAESVRSYLISRGLPADRVVAKGMGPDRPIADNTSAEGRANNRRVEIVVAKVCRLSRIEHPPAARADARSQTVPTPKLFFKQVYQRYTRDSLADTAGALSYYFVFALFPFLFLLTTLTAYVPYFRTSADTLLSRARDILPPQAMQLVSAHVEGLVARPRPRFLVMSLLLALYSASRGVDAVRAALNRAHDVQESRPCGRRRRWPSA